MRTISLGTIPLSRMAKVRCNGCKEYFDKDSAIRVGISNFCSDDCRFAKAKPKPAPKRDKPRTRKPGPSTDFPAATRERILERDGYRCRFCGKQSGNLAIHHIRYRSERKLGIEFLTSEANGITLCNTPCHLDVIHKDARWKKVLARVVSDGRAELVNIHTIKEWLRLLDE